MERVGSQKRKRSMSSSRRSVVQPTADTMSLMPTVVESHLPCPTDQRRPEESLSSVLLSDSDPIGGVTENDFIATYVEVGEDVTEPVEMDSECSGSNVMSTSDFCCPSTSTSSSFASSSIPTEVLNFKYPSVDNSIQAESQPYDCQARLYKFSNSSCIRTYSQLSPATSYQVLRTRAVKTTVYDNSSCEVESQASSFEVGVNDYLLKSRSFIRIHPVLQYNSQDHCSVTPIQVFLPAKNQLKSQICTIFRNSSDPTQVQVELEVVPTRNFVNTFETEAKEDSSQDSVSPALEVPPDHVTVHESTSNIGRETLVPDSVFSDVGVPAMSSAGPHKLKSSDVYCYVTSTPSINSQNCITTSAPAQTKILPNQIVQYSNVSQPTTMNILHIPQQMDFSSNQIIISPATHILPSASISTHPGLHAHSIIRSGSGQVLLTPGQQPINLIAVSNSGVIINQNPTTLLKDNPENHSLCQSKSLSKQVMPENKHITATIASQKYVINGPSNLASVGGSAQIPITDDLTNDEESGRKGFVSTCHHCGTLSTNFHCCDSCRRTIPRGSRISPDAHYRKPSNTNIVGATTVDPGVNSISSKKGKTSTARGGGGVMSKRGSRKKVQQECIVLSSDEEEECDPSPEKKAKLSADVPGSSSSSISQPLPSDSQEVRTPLQNSDIQADSLGTPHGISTSESQFDELKASAAAKAEDLMHVKDEIRKIVTSGDPSAFLQVHCRSFRVGTHKVVLDSTKDTFFSADICDKGVLFSMPHVTQSSKKVHLVIPHNSILAVTCHIDSSTILFLLFRTGNKIAKWVRDTLGMKAENRSQAWFDPHGGRSTEQNIIFMLQSFNKDQLEKIKKYYGSNLQVLDATAANQLLTTIAQPTYTNQISSNTEECIDSNTSVVAGGTDKVIIGVSVGSDAASKTVLSAIDKNKNKSQESKTVINDKPNSTVVGQDSKMIGPVSRSQAEKNKVKNGALPAGKSGNPNVQAEPINDGSRQILKWPKGQVGITLHQADLLTLRTEQFLNDQILDFWLMYFHNKLLSDVDRSRTHVFSTFFYSRLTTKPKRKSCAWEYDKNIPQAEKRHRRVKKWTKNVDIFSKDYIIVPINDNCHWYVAIICYPGLDGPHWVDDGTPIEGWTNVAVDKGKPKYNLPPGMTKRDDDKPPRKKKRRDYNRLLEDHLRSTSSEPVSGNSSSPATPTKQQNGILSVSASKVNTPKDDMDGNSTFPGVNSSPVPTSEKSVASKAVGLIKPIEDKHKQTADNCNKNAQSGNAVSSEGCNTKPKSSENSKSPSHLHMQHFLDNLYPDFDPYKDEAEDDPDEEALFEEYYFSDSDTNSQGSPSPGRTLDALSGNPEESSKLLAVSGTQDMDTTEEGSADLNQSSSQDSNAKQAKEEGEGSTSVEVETVSVKVEPKLEPMEVDVKLEENPTEDKKNIRTDFRIKQPCILLFNSLSGSPRSRVFATLREYLRLEYRERKGKDKSFTKFEMPGFEPNVPQQKNMCDCGIYVLEYVEHFFSKPFPSLLLALPSSLRSWFPQLITKRKEIYDTIVDLVKVDCPDNLRLLPAFELPPLPVATKTEKPDTASLGGLNQTPGPSRLSVKPEALNKLLNLKDSSTGKIEKICNVKNPKIPLPNQGSSTVKTEKKFVIPKLSASNKGENKVKPVKNDAAPRIPKILSKSSGVTKKVETNKKSEVAKIAEVLKKSEITKKVEAIISEATTPASTTVTPMSVSLESTKPALEATSVVAETPGIPAQCESVDTNVKTLITEEIPLSAVVSAPTQKIVPVTPSEEPMDIDV